MSVMMSSSIASWIRSLQKQTGDPSETSKPQVRQTGGPSVRQVPVQRSDESPGTALLLQQPAHSCCFTVLTRSEDHRLQHVHLKYDEGRTVIKLGGQLVSEIWTETGSLFSLFPVFKLRSANHILPPASYLKGIVQHFGKYTFRGWILLSCQDMKLQLVAS